ncbi:Nitrogenase iron protein 1 [Chlamydia trachomatis]|nr:Nitrogenase iron protein 1 [Chlamydia trachomatis]
MDKKAYEIYRPDVVLFDVLGDVVCGGFSMPIREGYADQVFILTSGEAMAIHAAKNIGLAVDTFQKRGYATLGGLIVNQRNVKNEQERIQQLCQDMDCTVLGQLAFDPLVQEADEKHQTVLEAYPKSEAAQRYRNLAKALIVQGEDRG